MQSPFFALPPDRKDKKSTFYFVLFTLIRTFDFIEDTPARQ